MSKEFDFFRPYKAEKVRMGSKYDGGYVLPKKVIFGTDILVTFGVSTNIDFEIDYQNKSQKSQIIMLDPFIGILNDLMRLSKRILGLTKPIKRHINLNRISEDKVFFRPLYLEIFFRLSHWFKFYLFTMQDEISFLKKGIGSSTNKIFLSVDDFWSTFLLGEPKKILLKIDIEGNEYEIMDQLVSKLENVQCLLIELHDVNFKMQEVVKLIDQLRGAGLFLVHIHGNNTDIADEYGVPNTLELSFAKEKYLTDKSLDLRQYPDKELDSPCNPCYEDYNLSFLNS